MYYCQECKEEFEEPNKERKTFESYYGVDHLFNSSHDFILETCPFCGSDAIEEMKKCDRCDEWNKEEDLIDTEELSGGGVGFYCVQCAKDCGIGD